MAGDAAFVMKGDKFIDCNDRTVLLFERSKEELMGKHPWEVSPEFQPGGISSKELAAKKIKAVLEGGIQQFEWVHIDKDTERFYVEVSLSAVFYAILRDINVRKRHNLL